MSISLVPILNNNYAFILNTENKACVIDPGSSLEILDALNFKGLDLEYILVTHHHKDHVAGVLELKKAYPNCQILGPKHPSLDYLNHELSEGERINILGFTFNIWELPGHTLDHIAFHEPQNQWLFSGDVLFGGGCGRVFEGSYVQMWEALKRIAKLPQETKIYCGHEYTETNLLFACSLVSLPLIQARLKTVQKKRLKAEATVPLLLGEELQTNPFLLAEDPSFARHFNPLKGLELFSLLRDKRNMF